MAFCHFLEVKFITEAKDFCVFFDGSYKNIIKLFVYSNSFRTFVAQ